MKPESINFHADTSADMLRVLRSTEIAVPARTAGRATAHTERWVGCRLLATLAELDRFLFPVKVKHRDRPDLLIEGQGKSIGIEITEAIPEEFAAYSAMAERQPKGAFLDLTPFRLGAPSVSTNEMREMLSKGTMSSGGWTENDPEKEWAQQIAETVRKKQKKLMSPEFEKFDENYLSIYDNLPLPSIDLNTSAMYLLGLLVNENREGQGFDRIYVEHGACIVEFCPPDVTVLSLVDLWKSADSQ